MGKYPIDISDEDNANLKYPFLPKEKYDYIKHYPDGPTIMIRGNIHNIPKYCIEELVKINRDIMAARILDEQETKEAAKRQDKGE
ncbi:MAG: hypothetical protein ABF904_09075 [Ethanoligenens sp.]